MSMIEEQIKELGEIHDELLENVELDCDINDFKDDWAKKINEAMRNIKDLSAKLRAANMERSSQYYNGGWIPCEEHMPVQPPDTFHDGHYWFTPCDDYIVCDSEGKVYVASFMFCNNFWFYKISSNQIKNIVAWRPLPEPYQPKESEE